MRSLKRPPTPACLGDGRRAWYDDLYKKDGSFKDRWNWQEAIRMALAAMAEHHCAWCERPLEPGWQVDHWLPKAEFPLVVYCWENLLPSCPGCNRRKSGIVPPALRGKKVIDPLLRDTHSDAAAFVKDELYPTLPERLIDPSFDEPPDHLEFVPAALSWRGLTPHGTFTINQLFSEKDDAERWGKLSEVVRGLITQGQPDSVIEIWIPLIGQETVFRALIAYWRDLLGASPDDSRAIGRR